MFYHFVPFFFSLFGFPFLGFAQRQFRRLQRLQQLQLQPRYQPHDISLQQLYTGEIETRGAMDVKGLTLRSKASRRRPKISAPQPITNHNTSAPAAGRTPEARQQPQPSDATSDLVKRRYSAKFNTLPGIDSEAPPVPSIPSAPIDQFVSDREPTSAGGAQPIRVDANALRNPNLPIESCMLNTSSFL